MTTSFITDEELRESVVPYTNFRIALATTILGSAGATLAWLMVLAYEAHDRKLLFTVTVGAVFGLIVHAFQHYIRLALRERRGEAHEHRERQALVAGVWALGFAFLGLASEHLIAEMVSHFLRPFLASLGSLIPAGAIIGWFMSRGRGKDKNLFEIVAEGLMIGAFIAIVTGIIWKLALGDIPWFPLLAWWGLIGLATRVMTRVERNSVSVGDPIAAIVMVFVGTFLINLLPLTRSTYTRLGAFGGMPLAIRTMAAEVLQSPGLPSMFWTEAERLAAADSECECADAARQEVQPQGRPIQQAPYTPTTGLNRGLNPENLRRVAEPPASQTPVTRVVDQAKTNSKVLIQSWIIVLCFAIGVGFAPMVEQKLRPPDYPNSRTFRIDIGLARALAGLLIVGCVIARYGHHT